MEPDIPANTTTTATLAVGRSVTGTIDVLGDQDWYRIELAPGTYQFDLRGRDSAGGNLFDPLLILHDSSGNPITAADDGGVEFDSRLVYTATGGTYYLNADSLVDSNPAYDIGTYTLSATLLDPAAPVAVGEAIAGTAEDTALVIDPATLLANDTDPNGDGLTVTAVGDAQGGAASLNPDGTITFTPTADFNGPASFDYTVSDGRGGTATATASFTVSPVNDAPVFGPVVGATEFAEAPGVTGSDALVGLGEGVTRSISDPDGDALTLGVFSPTFAWSGGALTTSEREAIVAGSNIQGFVRADDDSQSSATAGASIQLRDGALDFLAEGETLTATFGLVAGDGQATTPGPIAFTFRGSNDAPTALALAGGTVAENSAAGTVVGTLSAADPDRNDAVTFSLVPGEGDAGNAAFAVVGDELRLAVSPDYEAQASYSVRVRAEDGNGGAVERAFTVAVTDVAEARTLTGTRRADVLRGDGRDDTILGLEGNDKLYGNDGGDTLEGGAGLDALWGGAGRDTLNGGAGVDLLWGGANADTFVVARGGGVDAIGDFRPEDTVRVEGFRGVDGFEDLRVEQRGAVALVTWAGGAVGFANLTGPLGADDFAFG